MPLASTPAPVPTCLFLALDPTHLHKTPCLAKAGSSSHTLLLFSIQGFPLLETDYIGWTRPLHRKTDMYYFQILDHADEAEMLDAECSLVIVEKTLFDTEDRIDDNHILDDVIANTGLTTLDDVLEEAAESFFLSYISAEDLRALLSTIPGQFEERVLVEMEI